MSCADALKTIEMDEWPRVVMKKTPEFEQDLYPKPNSVLQSDVRMLPDSGGCMVLGNLITHPQAISKSSRTPRAVKT